MYSQFHTTPLNTTMTGKEYTNTEEERISCQSTSIGTSSAGPLFPIFNEDFFDSYSQNCLQKNQP